MNTRTTKSQNSRSNKLLFKKQKNPMIFIFMTLGVDVPKATLLLTHSAHVNPYRVLLLGTLS